MKMMIEIARCHVPLVGNFQVRHAILPVLLLLATFAHADPRNLAIERNDTPASDQRVALVIGNSTYKSAPLNNPGNDARAITAKLKALGFDVVLRENLGIMQVGGALREFRSKLKPGAVAVFFYAGHGMQVKGVNYLPAVDAEIASEEDVPRASLNVNEVLALMDEAKTRLNLVFLDACRDNPYARSFRSSANGLAKVEAPSGTLISFATRPGSVASDGTGGNGLYTENLLAAMEQPGLTIEQVLKRVISGVKQASKGRQEPWIEGSIEGEFYFLPTTGTQVANVRPTPLPAPTPVRVQSAEEIEQDLWNAIRDSRDAADFEGYLKLYPNGRFVALARQKLKTLIAPTNIAGGSQWRLELMTVEPVTCRAGTWDCKFAVRVVDERGQPVRGAKVAWRKPSTSSYTYVGETDERGISTATQMYSSSGRSVQTAALIASNTPAGFTNFEKVSPLGPTLDIRYEEMGNR